MKDTTIDYDLGFAKALLNLLHLTRASAQSEGQYGGPRRYIESADMVADHLNGAGATLAFTVCHKSKAGFLCLDVDAEWATRLHIIRGALKALKWEGAAFTTNGSDANRGKVFVTFTQPQPQRHALDMLDRLIKECYKSPDWHNNQEIQFFPTQGQGGLIRVGGRNPKRNGPLEQFFTLAGELTDLTGVVPLKIKKQPLTAIAPKIPAEITRLELYGFRDKTKPLAIMKKLQYVAYLHFLANGFDLGRVTFEQSLTKIRLATQKNQSRVDGFRESSYYFNDAFRHYQKNQTAWTPIVMRLNYNEKSRFSKYQILSENIGNNDTFANKNLIIGACTKASGLLYQKLMEYVRIKGLYRIKFAIDQETIGDLIGYTKRHTKRIIKDAVGAGIITIIEKGEFVPGKKSPATSYRLVSQDEFKASLLEVPDKDPLGLPPAIY